MPRENIIIGAARFYISNDASDGVAVAAGEPDLDPLPANRATADPFEGTAAAPGTIATDWRNVGFTTEGVEVNYEPDYADVEVDQLLDSAVIFKQGMRVTVNTTLAEATFENLLVAWGSDAGAVDAGRLSISSGELGDFPTERSLLFRGPAPRGTAEQRWYYLARAIQTESTSFALRRAEATTLPASFRCLPDEDTGEYGAIIDRTRATT